MDKSYMNHVIAIITEERDRALEDLYCECDQNGWDPQRRADELIYIYDRKIYELTGCYRKGGWASYRY